MAHSDPTLVGLDGQGSHHHTLNEQDGQGSASYDYESQAAGNARGDDEMTEADEWRDEVCYCNSREALQHF